MRFGISVLSILPTNKSEPAPIAKTGTYPAVWPEPVHPTIAIWLITFRAAAAKGSVLAYRLSSKTTLFFTKTSRTHHGASFPAPKSKATLPKSHLIGKQRLHFLPGSLVGIFPQIGYCLGKKVLRLFLIRQCFQAQLISSGTQTHATGFVVGSHNNQSLFRVLLVELISHFYRIIQIDNFLKTVAGSLPWQAQSILPPSTIRKNPLLFPFVRNEIALSVISGKVRSPSLRSMA